MTPSFLPKDRVSGQPGAIQITGQDMTWQGAGEAMAFGGVMGGLGGALSAKANTSEGSFTGFVHG